MAAEDIHVRLCLQEIVKLDLEVKAIVQVGIQKEQCSSKSDSKQK